MLLDTLGIEYDIYEASDRIGGRIYTHRFDQEAWDKSTPDEPAYYDYYVSASPTGCLLMIIVYTWADVGEGSRTPVP